MVSIWSLEYFKLNPKSMSFSCESRSYDGQGHTFALGGEGGLKDATAARTLLLSN